MRRGETCTEQSRAFWGLRATVVLDSGFALKVWDKRDKRPRPRLQWGPRPHRDGDEDGMGTVTGTGMQLLPTQRSIAARCPSSYGGLGSPSSAGARQHPKSHAPGQGQISKAPSPWDAAEFPHPPQAPAPTETRARGAAEQGTGQGTSRHAVGPGWDQHLPGAEGAERQRGAPQHPSPKGHRLIRSPNGPGLVAAKPPFPSTAVGWHSPAEPS